MQGYQELLSKITREGDPSHDRTGTGTTSLFAEQLKFDLREGFPLLTTKKVNFYAIFEELRWFLSGSSNINDLDSTIWDAWSTDCGSIGPMYGAQFRSWKSYTDGYIDQVSELIHNLMENPYSRRHILTSLNIAEVPDESVSPQQNVMDGKGALWPCHSLPVQFYVRDRVLHSQMYQRSADAFLGLPFNIASTALLTHMVAHVCGYEVGTYTHLLGDVHVYNNHLNQVEEQLARKPGSLPQLTLNPHVEDIFDFKWADLQLVGYDPYPAIKAPISI